MAQSGGQNEPSMEDILASIRRIITEDEKAQHTRPAAATRPAPEPVGGEDDEEDVLDLTERVEPAEEVPATEATAAFATDAAPQPTEPNEQKAADNQSDAAAEQAVSGSGTPAGAREGLVSAQTAAAAVAALSEVSRNLGNDNAKSQAGPAMEGQTLDALVRQALTPLLQAWLDENLPALVEDVVREEVQRLVIESRRR